MANFALIKENIVIAVIVVDNDKLISNGIEVEQLGIDFIDSLNMVIITKELLLVSFLPMTTMVFEGNEASTNKKTIKKQYKE